MAKLDARYFPLLLDVIDQSIFTVDREGRITFFNRSAEKTTGYSSEEVIGKQCSTIFRSDLCDKGCPLRRTIQSGQRVVDRRVRIHTKDGRSLPVSVTTAVLETDDGRLLGGVEVITDLSPLEHLQRQLDGKYRFEDIISRNAQMQQIFDMLPLVANSDSTVLILGDSGTGKELVAKAVHHQSGRRKRPFVAVNCAAMPETLMESELFGYIRGAFTDAKRDKPGRIAQADGGTLFLDEVGDLPLSIQVKLLRFLQERVYEPLGATFSTRADVRVISATHRNLEEMVRQGTFRQDLYFRLNVMQIDLPPLRERAEDIPLLADHFIQRFRRITGNRIEGIDDAALAALMHYGFPGNIRELENIIERAFILCQGPVIKARHLPQAVVEALPADSSGEHAAARGAGATEPLDLDPLQLAERNMIIKTLRRHKGNRSHAAAELGIHRSTLIRKLKRYAIP
jgi:PAS domain S-box-containing protein